MAKLIRWTPFRTMDLWNEFDRMLERPFQRPMNETRAVWQAPRSWGLAVDVAENNESYVVRASLPGVNPDDLEITLEDNVLTLRGEMKADETFSDEQYHLRERRFGSFGRRVRFPMAVNADAVEASYENGVLTLTVPKAEEVKPKRIAVKTG